MFTQHVIKRSLASAVVIAAAGFPPAAQAMLVDGGGPPAPAGSTTVRLPIDSYSNRALHPHGSASAASVQRSSQPAFQWGDAGLGAAGTMLLLGAGAGAAGVIRQRRAHRPIAG